jgi:hypothetical protein
MRKAVQINVDIKINLAAAIGWLCWLIVMLYK